MKLRALVFLLSLAALLAQPLSATTLMGQIEHSETLQPIENVLTPGQVLDLRNLPAIDKRSDNIWYRIPAWLSGTWHKDQQTDYFRYWYKTQQEDIETHTVTAKGDGTWGTQRDEKGNIWQYDPAPFTTTVDGGEEYVVQLVRVSEPVESTDQRFVRRSIDTQIRVDKLTNVIKSVESGEQLTTYIPEVGNLLRRSTSAKVFDQQGQPVLLGKSFSYERKTAEFAPQDMYNGKDMRSLFQQFLKIHSEQASLPISN